MPRPSGHGGELAVDPAELDDQIQGEITRQLAR
jgi:hypothetical protein